MAGVLGRYGASALKYWGSILASAYANASTADMWVAIRGAQQAYGLDRPGTSAPDVSVLRGYANRIANASRAFNGASRSDTLTSDMMAVAPYTSNDLNAIATTPTYQVRGFVSVTQADGTVTGNWMTMVYTGANMPGTVGGVIDSFTAQASDLTAAASGQTGTPTGTLTSVSGFEIAVV